MLPVHVQGDDQISRFCTAFDQPQLSLAEVRRQKPDGSWLLVDEGGNVAARCSLWWSDTPPYEGQRLGFIGHYAAHDAEAGGELLTLACRQLVAQDCTLAVGPIDGNTWQRYRFIVERGSHPLFFLEPDHPAEWPSHFTAGGFTPLAYYVSTLTKNLTQQSERLAKVANRAAIRGIHIRPFNLGHFEEELHQIYNIATASFQGNFLYTSISVADFIAQYWHLRPFVRPELILIAEQVGRPLGFVFALPDLSQVQRSEALDTVIIKTVAVHPDHQVSGLGNLLVARCQEIAHQLGFKRAIHALMHEKNASREISGRYQSQVIRRYALFAKRLPATPQPLIGDIRPASLL